MITKVEDLRHRITYDRFGSLTKRSMTRLLGGRGLRRKGEPGPPFFAGGAKLKAAWLADAVSNCGSEEKPRPRRTKKDFNTAGTPIPPREKKNEKTKAKGPRAGT